MNSRDASAEAAGRPNKSKDKRRTRALHELVRHLVALPPAKLDELSLGEALREGIVSAKKMKRTALARQLRYLTGLMRHEDADLISRQVQALSRPHRKAVQTFHQLEQWREALIAGDENLIDDLAQRFGADPRHLRQLAGNARRERERAAAPKSARLLFKYLAQLHPEEGD